MQQFKSVYFADHPAKTAKRKKVTLAFGSGDAELFELVSPLSSEEIRQAVGLATFGDLKAQAEHSGQTVNAFCLDRLRNAKENGNGQMSFPGIAVEQELRIDPIQATFRGGVEEPLHDWYPYLEGYSPEFVANVLDAYAPDAKHVLDPFAGCGTTPLTVARLGGHGSYCELNPLLQVLVETKAEVLALGEQKRRMLAARLRDLADELPRELRDHGPDGRLSASYEATFGQSQFFPAETMESVLRLRAWLDAIDCTDPEAAAVASISVAASLVPASNLVRRGDLRFRKGEAEKRLRVDDLVAEVADRVRSMAEDLERIEGIKDRPRLIAADAKRLGRCAGLEVDAVITSPPYLNGTNYYRNTKIELWFLRALLTGQDLSEFRRQTVTAGINDVTSGKRTEPVSDTVRDVVEQLESDSYDRRIPQMVLSYFGDMAGVIDGLAGHVRKGAPLLIDIGDSVYAGVHVDTPAILAGLLADRGWKVNSEVTLRRRMSRSGVALRQVLVAAEAPKRQTARTKRPAWSKRWTCFTEALPHQSGEFAKRNWGSPLHSLCSYQGKMKPSLARHLVEAFVSKGDRLLDPFGGVGTIPFEAAGLGVQTWSFDISPAAVPIAAAKLQPAQESECRRILAELGTFIRAKRVTKAERAASEHIRFNGPLKDYFHPKTFDEVILARRYFQECPPADPNESLVFAALLHVLHGNRPYALSRRSHPITPFSPTGEAVYKSLIEKVTEKVDRSLNVDRPDDFVPGASVFQDATGLWPVDVDDLDAVITSPPFFDSTRFYLANWMRLWFSGWTSEDFKKRPLAFVDERQKQDFRVYEAVIRQARERLKPGGVCVFHLGKSRKCDMAEEIGRIARPWFSSADVFAESVEHCESHGIRDKGTVVEHTYLVLH